MLLVISIFSAILIISATVNPSRVHFRVHSDSGPIKGCKIEICMKFESMGGIFICEFLHASV
jgi:hypothetical protein